MLNSYGISAYGSQPGFPPATMFPGGGYGNDMRYGRPGQTPPQGQMAPVTPLPYKPAAPWQQPGFGGPSVAGPYGNQQGSFFRPSGAPNPTQMPGTIPPFQWRGGRMPIYLWKQGWRLGQNGNWLPPGSQNPYAKVQLDTLR